MPALRAPALSMDADFDRPKRTLNLDPKLAAYRRRRIAPARNRVFVAASRFEGHVLVVESEHDSVIPHAVVANYLRAFRAVASRRHEVIAGPRPPASFPAARPPRPAHVARRPGRLNRDGVAVARRSRMEPPPHLIASAQLADELAVFLERLRRTTEALEAALREAEQVSGRRRPVSGEDRAA